MPTRLRRLSLFSLPVAGLCCLLASGVAAEPVPFDAEQLLSWNQDWVAPHEASLAGVPRGYDWAKSGRLRAGNDVPAGFTAMTGWGQVFWAGDAKSHAARIELRNHQMFACIEPGRRWERLQNGPIAGAAFRADFANNEAKAPAEFTQTDGVSTVQFGPLSAFHFWPKSGRTDIPSAGLCGLVVAVEARAIPPSDAGADADPSGLLVGLGADFWQSRTAGWNNYKTNTDVGVSRVKRVGAAWRWYGMSTASDADLRKLASQGYTDKLRP